MACKFKFCFLLLFLFSACPTKETWQDQLLPRVKILVLGESTLAWHFLIVDNDLHPDLGLFIFDVVSDIVNGVNFINDGNPGWGIVIISATFLPVTFFLAQLASTWFFIKASWRQRVLMVLMLPMISPIAIALATPAYILYVVFVFAMRVKEPSYVSNHLDTLIESLDTWKGKSRFAQTADLLKMNEAITEANIQAIISM